MIGYLSYQNVKKSNDFRSINGGNIDNIMQKINDFIKDNPENRYNCILIRDFLLGTHFSLVKEKITLAELSERKKTLDNYINTILEASYFNNLGDFEREIILKMSGIFAKLELVPNCNMNSSNRNLPY